MLNVASIGSYGKLAKPPGGHVFDGSVVLASLVDSGSVTLPDKLL